MNSTIIWIIFPSIVGIILFFVRKWYRISIILGTLIALALAGIALIMPFGELIRLGPVTFRILENFDVLGRQFLLEDKDRFLLAICYTMVAFWFAGSYLAKSGRIMIPFGFLLMAVFISAFAVVPFLYGAILVEIAVIVCIPLIIQSSMNFRNEFVINDQSPNYSEENYSVGLVRGSLRFLIFQTIGMPFLLITGWVLAGIETTPGEQIVIQTAGLLGFGFMLILALFPFHSWVLMLIETAHPYVTTFVIVVFTWFVTLFGLRFMDQYLWLRQDNILNFLRSFSVIILVFASVSVIFEQHLGRMLGYALLMETGYILLAASINEGNVIIFQMLLPRIFSFGTWALSLVLIKTTTNDLNLKSLRGFYQFMPVTVIAVILAQMSIAGLPLLAAFPVRYVLWIHLTQQSIWIGRLSLAGFVGLTIASIRSLAILIGKSERKPPVIVESWSVYIILGTAIIIMFLVGIMPDLFLPIYQRALYSFGNLVPVP